MAAVTAGVVATVAVGAMSANAQKKGAQGAANASDRATNATVGEQKRQYDQTRQDNALAIQAGQDAIRRQNAFLGGDFTGFQASPDYAYAQQQMTQGLDRGAAARGRLYSGGYGVDMAAHLNGLANSNVSSYWNRLAGQAGQGQTATNLVGAAGASSANAMGNAWANNANARASAFQTNANANSNMYGAALGAFSQWMNRPQATTTASSAGSNPTAFGNNWGTGGFGSGWGG